MKRKVLFAVAHLSLVLIISLYSFFNQMEFSKNPLISMVSKVYQVASAPVLHEYVQLAGIDAGYGYYGRNVATSKFFLIELRNKEEELLISSEFKRFFNSQNTYVRFETLASKLYNTVVDLEDLQKQAKTSRNARDEKHSRKASETPRKMDCYYL